MAASALGSITVSGPRPAPATAAIAPPPPSAVLCGRGGGRLLLEFRGLRSAARPRLTASASCATTIPKPARRGLVICEAQEAETAVEVPDVTKATWQSLVIESDTPVLVEFWAPWCGPCRMIHPVIGNLSKVYGSKLKCLKLNTDESPEIARQYGVRSIPTIMVFKNGEKKDAVFGAVPEGTIITCIDKFVEQ